MRQFAALTSLTSADSIEFCHKYGIRVYFTLYFTDVCLRRYTIFGWNFTYATLEIQTPDLEIYFFLYVVDFTKSLIFRSIRQTSAQ